MSTRSAVGVPQGDSWHGRYVHSDGYPSGVGVEILALVERDGLDAVVRKVTEDRYGWSSLDNTQPEISGVKIKKNATYGTYQYGTPEYVAWNLSTGSYGDGRFANEPGYGIAYTTLSGQSSPEEWITPEDDDYGTEWAYVLSSKGVAVLENVGEWKQVAFVNWGDTAKMASLG